MPDTRLHIKVSPEWLERLDEFCKRVDMNRTAVIKAAVHEYLAKLEDGILDEIAPIVAVEDDDAMYIIDGHHRYLGALAAGVEPQVVTVPKLVFDQWWQDCEDAGLGFEDAIGELAGLLQAAERKDANA